MIKIKFLGTLAKHMASVDENGYWVLPEDSITIEAVLGKTNIATETVKYSTLVNNMRKPIDYLLSDDDILMVMPLFAGG